MANHIRLDSTDVTPLERSADHNHNVTKQNAHLRSKEGAKGASVPIPLHDMLNAEKDHDSEFSTQPKTMRSHLDSKQETK